MSEFAYNPRLKHLREYPPTKDWAGLGYNHHMVVSEDANMPNSGVGQTKAEAYRDLLRNRTIKR